MENQVEENTVQNGMEGVFIWGGSIAQMIHIELWSIIYYEGSKRNISASI